MHLWHSTNAGTLQQTEAAHHYDLKSATAGVTSVLSVSINQKHVWHASSNAAWQVLLNTWLTARMLLNSSCMVTPAPAAVLGAVSMRALLHQTTNHNELVAEPCITFPLLALGLWNAIWCLLLS